ncbi:hypothetical protein R1flu_012380 [Riccia fluitans]|uniref:Pre-rRNA-processing protein Ipi1 N-terminal domain-containing protein n=1 Tax=Riccia fluitans TaxID=41844 RepID=A0ABD1ZBL2_9MARC
MAPGPPQKRQNPKAKSKKALSVDFKRVKSKVGKKLAPAKNATKIEFKAKGIVVPGQSVGQDKSGLAVSQRKQTLKELLSQTSHYSERTRKDALIGLKDLFGRHPKELIMHAVVVIEKLSPRITDADKGVRQALVLLLRTSVLPHLPQAMMKPLIPVVMAHVCSAMTHLVLDIRVAACSFLELLLQHCPTLILPKFSGQVVQHYISLLGKNGITGQAGTRLISVLSSLEHFLSAQRRLAFSRHSQISAGSSLIHIWGAQYDIKHRQEAANGLQSLHAYKSAHPEGNQFGALAEESQGQQKAQQNPASTGAPGQVSSTVAPLVTVLLECWTEWSPLIKGPNPDSTSLDCLVIITRCLYHIFQTISNEAASKSSAKNSGSQTALCVPDYGSEEWEAHVWMQQEFLPRLCRHLLNCFPCTAPVVRLPPKVEEGLVALNMGVCEILLQFFPSSFRGMEDTFVGMVLQCIVDALYGKMLPASEYVSALSDPRLAELHTKTWIQYLPGLVTCVPSDWVSPLFEACTHVFESCNSRSNLKLICLSTMSELLLPGRSLVGKRKLQQTLVPVEFQTRWLESLPKLLWELKNSHPHISQAVLEMLLHLGRSSPESSVLAERYNGLQQAMVPFFCAILKQRNETRWLFGPFISLPEICQTLATDLLFYYTSISPIFLKVLAQCCLCPELNLSVAVRIVEVLHQGFCKGAIDTSEHLSFLTTLLLRRISSENDRSLKKPEGESTFGAMGSEQRVDLSYETRKRRSALVGAVCACLGQIGDGHVVLDLLGPSIRQELETHINPDVVEGLFRVFAVLSYRDQKSDGVYIPGELFDIFPRITSNFLVFIFQIRDVSGGSANEALCSSLKRPCLKLLSRSRKLTGAVLNSFHEILTKDVDSSSLEDKRDKVTAAEVVLDMLKTEKLDRALLGSKVTFKAILKSLEVYGDMHTSEGRDLKRLHEQLMTATNAQFGSEFAAR